MIVVVIIHVQRFCILVWISFFIEEGKKIRHESTQFIVTNYTKKFYRSDKEISPGTRNSIVAAHLSEHSAGRLISYRLRISFQYRFLINRNYKSEHKKLMRLRLKNKKTLGTRLIWKSVQSMPARKSGRTFWKHRRNLDCLKTPKLVVRDDPSSW